MPSGPPRHPAVRLGIDDSLDLQCSASQLTFILPLRSDSGVVTRPRDLELVEGSIDGGALAAGARSDAVCLGPAGALTTTNSRWVY